MSLLDTLKSLLGMERTDSRTEGEGDVGVTVEREAGDEPEPVSSPSDGETGGTEAETGADDETDATPEAEAEPEPEDEPEPEADEGDTDGEPTDSLEGIGPAYAERLSEAGIETVAQLADADAADLAEKTDIAQGRLETWIERAANR